MNCVVSVMLAVLEDKRKKNKMRGVMRGHGLDR